MAGAAPAVFTVEQASTFDTVMLMDVQPKLAFKSDQQEMTKDGLGKWEAHLTAGFKAFGKTEYTMLKVVFVAEKNPGDGIAPGTPVQLVGLQVGVMDKVIKDKETGESRTVGAQVWYRADEIRSLAATGPSNGRKSQPSNGEAVA